MKKESSVAQEYLRDYKTMLFEATLVEDNNTETSDLYTGPQEY